MIRKLFKRYSIISDTHLDDYTELFYNKNIDDCQLLSMDSTLLLELTESFVRKDDIETSYRISEIIISMIIYAIIEGIDIIEYVRNEIYDIETYLEVDGIDKNELFGLDSLDLDLLEKVSNYIDSSITDASGNVETILFVGWSLKCSRINFIISGEVFNE